MIGTRTSIARLTAVPIAPDELSMFSSDGESWVRNNTVPSAASIGSLRLTALISVRASLMRVMAGSDRQPNAPRRKREANVHTCLLEALLITGRLDRVG